MDLVVGWALLLGGLFGGYSIGWCVGWYRCSKQFGRPMFNVHKRRRLAPW